MESKELKGVISWIINRKCGRDDNIHLKRAVRESKKILALTKWEKEEMIEKLIVDISIRAGENLDKIEHPFPYVSKIIYDSALPKIFDNYTQDHIQKFNKEDYYD